jgi:hypothetical protein
MKSTGFFFDQRSFFFSSIVSGFDVSPEFCCCPVCGSGVLTSVAFVVAKLEFGRF